MNKIEQQLKRFEKLDVWLIIKNVIEQNEDFLVGLIRGQLWKGEDKDGRTPKYSRSPMVQNYIQRKLNQGKIESSTLPYMNLYDTGAFQKAIEVQVKDKYVEILSRDSKSEKLQDKYGTEILEPNEERMTNLINFILPKLQEKLRKQLGY